MADIKEFEEKMNKTIDTLLEDYATIRAGRANPHILDKIRVDYWGTPTPLQQNDSDSALGVKSYKGNREDDSCI